MYTQSDDTTCVSFVHISTSEPTVGVFLTFSDSVYEVTAQGGAIPLLSNANSMPPYDPIGRAFVQEQFISSIVVPALAAQLGEITTDFYALVYHDSSSPPSPSISVTASTISPTTREYNGQVLSFAVSTSSLPQIFRIPFHKDLQVVSTEVIFSNLSCVDEGYNATSVSHIFLYYSFVCLFLNW